MENKKKKAGLAILVSDKMDFKPTKIKRDKEGHYIMVKKINALRKTNDPKYIWTNKGAPRYIRQVLNDL